MLGRANRDAKKFALRTGKKWVNSKLIDYCAECDRKFTIINRKHHCRQCGEVVCNECSRDRMVIRECASSPLRTCRSCYADHKKNENKSEARANRPNSSEDARNKAADFDSVNEKINNCFTTKKYQYGPSPSQFFVLHIPREVIPASAAVQSPQCQKYKSVKSVPIIVLLHGGFWKKRYGINSSHIETLVPFFLSKGMAVCQIEYRRVPSNVDVPENISSSEEVNSNAASCLSVSPTFLQQYPDSFILPSHISGTNRAGGSNGSSSCDYGHQRNNDTGGCPYTNEDILQALRLLHHKCCHINSNKADSFTHHYIAVNGSRCISRLAKLDISRITLLGHSAGGYLALWACCNLEKRKLPFNPVLCVAVAPVCNLSEAIKMRLGNDAVSCFLGSTVTRSQSLNCLSDANANANVNEFGSRCDDEKSSDMNGLMDYACPSKNLPVEVPLLLAIGANDDTIPVALVEDFYWQVRECSFGRQPPLSLSLGSTDVATDDGSDNHISKDSKSSICFRESGSVPVKLLKLDDADHYGPVCANDPSFLKMYDELFNITPSLADIPDLDILSYSPDEIQCAMSCTSSFGHVGDEDRKLNEVKGEEDIAPSSSTTAVKEKNDDISIEQASISNNIEHPKKISSRDFQRVNDSALAADTISLESSEKLTCFSYSSSDDGFDYYSALTPHEARVRKGRSDTNDSRENAEQDAQPNQKKPSSRIANTTNEAKRSENDQTKNRDSRSNSDTVEFFSFPAPVGKSKRRSFKLPKFL